MRATLAGLTLGVVTAAKVPGALPSQLTSFIGRGAMVALVRDRLPQDRLVTLVGPGGCGKTRLGLEVARGESSRRAHGVFFVDLSGLSDPELVPSALVRALGLRVAGGRDPVEVLVSYLRTRDTLILLDNCEHVVEACAILANVLARGCPGLWILATSRQALGLTGELVVPVEGLQIADRARVGGQVRLGGSEAGRLFVDRARLARPDFALDADDELAIADICERLDGIPLALELAAARARMMSVRSIADGLRDRFRLLIAGSSAVPSRHRTLLSSIEWSCALLGERERSLLHRLSVFASGFTLASVEAVCSGGDVDREDALSLLTALVEKSLVQAQPPADRFRLHETMRAYTSTQLEAAGATTALRDRHLEYFFELAGRNGSWLFGQDLVATMNTLEPELDNLRAAIDWGIESKSFNLAADLVEALALFFYVLGLRSEGWALCERLIAKEELDPSRRAAMLLWAGNYAWYTTPEATLRLASQLIAHGRGTGDEQAVARGMRQVGMVQMYSEPEAALGTFDEAVALARRVGANDAVVEGLALKVVAYLGLARPREALSCSEDAFKAAQESGSLWAETWAREQGASAALHSGHLGKAFQQAEGVLRVGKEISDPLFISTAESIQGEVRMCRGERGAAEALVRAGEVAEACGDVVNRASVQAKQARLQVFLGRLDDGYRALEAATIKIEALGGFTAAAHRAALAEVALWRGDLSAARQHLDRSLARQPASPDAWLASTLRAAARLARSEGQVERSVELACKGLGTAFGRGALLETIELLELVAIVSADDGYHSKAARLLGAAQVQREVTGYVQSAPLRRELAPVVAGIEAALEPPGSAQALSEGRLLTLDQAVAYARRGRGPRRRPASGWASLTPTERQIASLVAERLSNAEIAARMFVSTATVKAHLTRIFAKLGVPGRRQLAVAAQRRGGASSSDVAE